MYQQDYCAGRFAIVVQARAEANYIWLCRAQPTINKINLPELNIRIFNPLASYFF